jgi:hypothetical protein
MDFVLANRILIHPGGTEVHLVTIGEQLQRLGHEVVLYAPELGPFADYARRRGLEVRGSLRELPERCDVVFAQDGIVAYELAERYPRALNVFRVCGDVYDFQLPPQLTGVLDLIVVLSERYERLARATAVTAPIVRLRVPVDVSRLVPLGALRERVERAVLLGNYPARDDLVREAWGPAGVEVRRVGFTDQSYDVAEAIADADVVVAKSRAALDAMACGRAVYVLDVFGGDGWVTPERYPALEADQFAGQATERVLDVASLAADLPGYSPGMGPVNRDLVLQHHDPRNHVLELVRAIGEHRSQERPRAPLRELSRLTALQWSWEETAREFRGMYWPMRAHVVRVEHERDEARRALAEALAAPPPEPAPGLRKRLAERLRRLRPGGQGD